jgi:hypothetical protein
MIFSKILFNRIGNDLRPFIESNTLPQRHGNSHGLKGYMLMAVQNVLENRVDMHKKVSKKILFKFYQLAQKISIKR